MNTKIFPALLGWSFLDFIEPYERGARSTYKEYLVVFGALETLTN